MKSSVTWVTLRNYYERLERMRLVLSRLTDKASPERQHVEEQAAAFEKEITAAIDRMTVERLKEEYRRALWHKAS